MRQLALGLLLVVTASISCKTSGTMAAIQPKSGSFGLPAKGKFRICNGLTHPGFSVTLTNSSTTQSCEVYEVTDNGNEKWVSPSLQGGDTLTVNVPSNGHLFFKNFNDNILKIDYKVED